MADIIRRVKPAPTAATRPTSVLAGSLDREIRFRVTASTGSGQKKLAEVWSEAGGQPASSRWSIQCDEGPRLGGEDSAPSPLGYFSAAVAF